MIDITEAIRERARASPDAHALVRPAFPPGVPATRTITYRVLDRTLDSIARRALALGLRPGAVAGIAVRGQLRTLILMLALARAGIAFRTKSVTGAGLDVLFVAADAPAMAGVRTVVAEDTWFDEPDDGPQVTSVVSGSAICGIFPTSGSTGAPKRVAVSHDMMAERLAAHDRAWPLPDPLTLMCPQGPSGGYGFRHMLHALQGGATVVIARQRQDLADVIERHGVNYLVAPPGLLGEIAAGRPAGSTPLPTLVTIEVGGSELPHAVLDRALATLCPTVICQYGSTETGIVSVGRATELAGRRGAVGVPVPGVMVEAVGDDGVALPPGTTGTIRIRCAGMADRYVDDPVATARMFRDGWFYPGDRGSVTADRVLVIDGRDDDLINAGGNKINPRMIEDMLLAVPGVTEAAAFGMPGEHGVTVVCAAIVADNRVTEDDIQALTRKMRSHAPRKVLYVKALPRNENGKVDREELVRQVAAAQRARSRASA